MSVQSYECGYQSLIIDLDTAGGVVERNRRGLWLLLIAMTLIFLGQAGTGFDRPVTVIIG
jgi:hypothetical protein